MAGWRSVGNMFSSGFVGHSGFSETRLDGLAKLPTIPPRCIARGEQCSEINRTTLLSVCRKDARNGVG